MVTEEQVRQIIGVEGAGVLVDVMETAWAAQLAEGKMRSRYARARIMFDYMIERADEVLAPMEGVRRGEHRGNVFYALQERLLLRFKKHSETLRTSNVRTRTQAILAREGHFDGMPTPLEHISCGYVLDAAEAGLAQLVAVRRVAGEVEFWIDLRELADGVVVPAAPILPGLGPDTSVTPLPSIARRKQEQDGTE